MLLSRTPSPPKRMAGRTIAYGDVALGQGPLHQRLAPEIGRARVDTRVRDAHVDDPLHPGTLGCVEEGPGVGRRPARDRRCVRLKRTQ